MKTKVFISWAGPHSKQVALVLREYLPQFIQALDPWMSEEDILKGERWSPAIAKQLEGSKVGILCITPDNLKRPWLLFEAGALAKSMDDDTRVCPFLHRVGKSDVEQPLGMFQATSDERDDVLKLLKALNVCCSDDPVPENQLSDQFDRVWPEMEAKLNAIEIPDRESIADTARTADDKIGEILSLVRSLKRARPADRVLLERLEVAQNVARADLEREQQRLHNYLAGQNPEFGATLQQQHAPAVSAAAADDHV